MTPPRRKVDFLEDFLKRYGVEADYWPSADDTQPVEAISPTGTTFEDAITASENWRKEMEMLPVDLRSSWIPLFVQCYLRAEDGRI